MIGIKIGNKLQSAINVMHITENTRISHIYLFISDSWVFYGNFYLEKTTLSISRTDSPKGSATTRQ